jgi:hypothetical protein
LLGEKDSPADVRNKIYNFLLKYKVKYDVKEHNQYIKWRDEEDAKNKTRVGTN